MQGKKPSPSELKVDEQIPYHKNSHHLSQRMKNPPPKKLRKKSFIWLLPITAIGPPPASVMYVLQLDRKN
jgi:hypothetical protein